MKNFGALWRVHSFGEEIHLPGQPYWWVNRNRGVSGQVIVQYTLQGVLRHRQSGSERQIPVSQACLFTHSDGSAYGLQFGDPDYACLWISLCGAGLVEHWAQIIERYGPIAADSNGRLLQRMRDLIRKGSLSAERNPIDAAAATHGFVMELIRSMECAASPEQRPVERAVSRLRANPYYPWSLKELTTEEGCSREHFSRLFMERYGQSPAAWLSAERAAHAVEILRTTRLAAEDVALQCGFSGAIQLARTLHRLYGKGPRALREP